MAQLAPFTCSTFKYPLSLLVSLKNSQILLAFYMGDQECKLHADSLALTFTKHKPTPRHTHPHTTHAPRCSVPFSPLTSSRLIISRELKELNAREERRVRHRARERKMNVGYLWTLVFCSNLSPAAHPPPPNVTDLSPEKPEQVNLAK